MQREVMTRGRRLVWIAAGLVCLAVAAGVFWYVDAVRDLPPIAGLERTASIPSSYIYDRQGRLLYELVDPAAAGSHAPLPLQRIPRPLQQAVVATEDATFYANPGFSPVGILRAAWINLRAGRVVAGGSTITQQVVRNLLMTPNERYEQTLRRKVREVTLAVRLSLRFSKGDLLAIYLNQTYFGNFAYGADAAARAYFGVPAEELDLAQCALLAGLIQSPAAYNPLEHLDAARARQRVVLELMRRQGYISAEDAARAAEEPLYFAPALFRIEAPHFVMYVAGLLEHELGRERMQQGGLRVYTTLDLDMQRAAEAAVRRRLDEMSRKESDRARVRADNAGLIALDPRSGEILAMVGSPDYFDQRISGAVNATLTLRQPGSALKPFTYAAAFAKDYTPATLLLDVRASFTTREGIPYVPENYDRRYHGPVLARQALASSLNVPAVRVLDHIGVERLAELLSQLGVNTLQGAERYGLSLTLGGGEVRLLDLTAAYAALAAGGRSVEPVALRYVEDAQGRRLREWRGGPRLQVLSPQVAYLITDILSDDQARILGFGEGSVLQLSRPAAVKTGTTTDWRDNWIVGYTPDLAAGVWVGNADNAPMVGVSGVSGAGPIWHDFMEDVLKGRPAIPFERPAGLVEVVVCAESGELPNPDCPQTRSELFVAGTQPMVQCSMHRRLAIDKATGLLATRDTPPERIMERVYTILPAEAQEWARQQGLPQPPLEAAPAIAVAGRNEAPLVMTSPDAGTTYQLSPALPREAQRIEVAARPAAGLRFTEVELYVDDTLLGRFAAEPYAARWALEPGAHRVYARGRLADGAWVESAPAAFTVEE